MDKIPAATESSPRVVTPASAQEVADVLKQASDAHLAVIPVGGRTMLDYGAPPSRADLLLSLEKLNHVLAYEPANLTVRAEAGISLGALNDELAKYGQFLPLDPPCPDRATLGGILATNASGPLRIRFGSARDLLIGIRVALTNGQVVHGGGEVVKNVAGYDLPKLFVGSLGTLGVIVEASFKLAPLPVETATVAATFSDPESAASVALRTLQSRLLPIGLEILNPVTGRSLGLLEGYSVVTRASGLPSSIARHVRDVTEWSTAEGATVQVINNDRDLWALIRDFAVGRAVVARIGLLPTQVAEMIQEAEALSTQRGLKCSIQAQALGIILIALEGDLDNAVDVVEALRDKALAHRGYLVLERAPADIRQRVDVWGPPRPDFELMRKLKHEFDPAGVLNPGRFVGGL